MSTEQIYVTDFIVPDLHFAMNDYTNSSFKGYQPLVNSINTKKVQLRITEEFYEKLEYGRLNEKDPLIREAYNKFISWISASMIKPITSESYELPDPKETGLRKSLVKIFAPLTFSEISSALHDFKFDSISNEEMRTIKAFEKLLIHSKKLISSKYEFLFKTQELPTFKVDDMNDWFRNITSYTVPTNVVRIIDKYFIKNNKEIELNKFIKNLIANSPKERLKVEIITDINKAFGFRVEKNKKMTLEWIKRASTDSTEIDVYHIVKNATEFHDRHLWTEYWNLQIQAGIDGKKNLTTLPVLTGRYAPNALSWKRIEQKWKSWTDNDCTNVRILT